MRRLLFGITLGVVVTAVMLISLSLSRGDGTSAQEGEAATNPNDGSLAGVADIVVGSVNTGAGLFYCIIKTDHDGGTNAITVYAQCNTDIENGGVAPNPDVPPTWSDTCDALADRIPPECVEGQLNNPSETGADTIAGPPPPPPYTIAAPSIGLGFFYPGGIGAPGDVCVATDCTVVSICFEDVGPIAGTGPNIIWTAVLLDPKAGTTVMADTDGDTDKDTQVDRVSSGTVDIWYNQSNQSCTDLAPKGDPTFGGLPLQSIQVNDKNGTNINPNPAPWRPGPNPGATVLDFDGDGCTDEQELDPKATGKCGDDPQNPSDSFSDVNTVDLSGVYDILVRVDRGDCTDSQCVAEEPGFYFFCRSDLQHDTGDNSIVLRPYCYTDSPGIGINPEAYPGIAGDGMAGAPPPGPETVLNSGNYAYGDVNITHAELAGTFNKIVNKFQISGCFVDQDGQDPLGDVYWELTASAHQLPGTVDIWILQDNATCVAGAAFFEYPGAPTFDDADLFMVQPNPNKGKGYDQDNDGVPTAIELNDSCRRDPYNKNDYYDVSIPRDGVIDLPNDILGVIIHFAPGGYPAGDENWDRPPVIPGAAGLWNRGSPDGVIDLPNDILGVILQFNPGGAAAGCGGGVGSPNEPPEAGGEMALSVTNGEVSCPQGKDPSHVCVPANASFTLTVAAVDIPAAGYILAQSWIDYGNDLIYKSFQSFQITWPDCEVATLTLIQSGAKGSNHVAEGCLTGFGTPPVSPLFASFHTGSLIEYNFNCSPGASTTEVKLLTVGTNPANTSGAMYTEFGTNTQFLPAVNNVTINCLGEAEPVETVSTMIDETGGSLSTGTGDPVEVELTIPAGALAGSAIAGSGGITVTIDVFLTEDLPEIVGDAQTFSRVFRFEPEGQIFDPPATAIIHYEESEVAGIDEATLDVMVYDESTGEWEVAVVERDPDNNTLTIEMGHFSHRLPTQRDADQDGCPNEAELGPDENIGGLRDWTNRWDYYDVLGPGSALPRDRIIDLPNDVLGVVLHFSPTGYAPNTPSIVGNTTYEAFDRGPQIGANVWNMSPPDGVIDLPNDILGVILQRGHDCSAD